MLTEEREDYKILRWLGSFPMYMIGAMLPYFLFRGMLIRWIFYTANGNPITEEEISGVLSFIYVVVVKSLMHIAGLISASFVAVSPLKFISRFSWFILVASLLNMGLYEFFDIPIVSNGDDPVYVWTDISLGFVWGVGGLYLVKTIKD